MSDQLRMFCLKFLLTTLVVAFSAGSNAIAQDAAWRVSKASGDVSISASGAQPVALTDAVTVNPGDVIRTGQNGRVLLMRGAESMLITANTVVGLPKEQKDGLSTTIMQQAGTILLEVEKRNVKHFEVKTPYLAAVVKGTKFRVTVNKNDSSVDVVRGQVEVTDFKSGQIAMVLPGQTASVSQDSSGLSLSGSGTLSPIQQGIPRQPSVVPLTVIQEGLATTDDTAKKPKVREALALGEGTSIPVLSSTNGVNTSMWSLGRFFSRSDEGGAWWNRSDSLAFDIAFPFGVGFVVAVGVAAQRRRQRQKQAQPPRPTAS